MAWSARDSSALDLERLDAQALRGVLRRRSALLALAQREPEDLDSALRAIVKLDAETLDVARVSYWTIARDASQIACAVLFRSADSEFEQGAILRADQFPAYFAALSTHEAIIAHD